MTIHYAELPRLRDSVHERTSNPTPRENCIAHAVGAPGEWWEPTTGRYWPVGPPYYNYSIESLVYVFERLGFAQCDSVEYEPEHEKIAIYGKNKKYTHVARQLASGTWTSKLGAEDDISHANLECLADAGDGTGEYGKVVCVMKRAISHSKGSKCCENTK
jgi:hypothetical protein